MTRAEISAKLTELEDLEARRGRAPTREELRRLAEAKRGGAGRNESGRRSALAGLLAGVRTGEDNTLDGEEALVDLAEGDLDVAQPFVEADVVSSQLADVVAHVGDSGVESTDERKHDAGQQHSDADPGAYDGEDEGTGVAHRTQGTTTRRACEWQLVSSRRYGASRCTRHGICESSWRG